jgi:CRISPR-associated protein Cas2
MAETDFVVVFAYDIERDANRRRIADLLESHATRVQKSVFEGRMSLKAAENLLRRLDRERADGDSIRMYVLTEQSRDRSQTRGGAPILERSEFWLL